MPLFLTLLIVGSYCRSFEGPFIFDDSPAIENNLSIRDIRKVGAVLMPPNTSGTTVNGRPVVNLSLATNYAVGGLDVRGYHLVNLLIHLGATLALWGVARRLFAATLPSSRAQHSHAVLAAGLVAALWGAHPLQTQAVTYIVQRAESLVGLFLFLSLYCFCRAQTAPRRMPWLVGSVVACLLGVGTKEVIAAAPLLVLLCDRAFYAGTFRRAWERSRAYYVALFATWVPLLALIFMSQGRGGTVGFNLAGITWWTYLLTQAEALIRYIATAVWPVRLVFDYGTGVVGGLKEVWPQGTAVLVLLGLTVWALLRAPRLGFLGAWFFLILAPSSSFVPIVTETMAEHRMYLPLAALIGLGVAVSVRALGVRAVVWGGAAVALGLLTFRRNEDYRSAEALWASSVRHYPQSARAHNNLGELFAKRRRFDLALPHIQAALRLQPTYLDALCNLSSVLSQVGRMDEALVVIEGLAKGHPREVSVQSTYGGILYRLGRRDEAVRFFRRTLELAPLNLDANNNLGVFLSEEGRPAEALPHFEAVLAQVPQDGSALFNLANALVRLGRTEEAEKRLLQCVAVEPTRHEAYNNLGAIYAQWGRREDATAQFRKSVEIAPEFPDALNNLGVMLSQAGETEKALVYFERAIKARPDYPDARENLRRSREALEAAKGSK